MAKSLGEFQRHQKSYVIAKISGFHLWKQKKLWCFKHDTWK